MRDIVKAFRRPPAVRPRDRNGGFPRLSGGVALVLAVNVALWALTQRMFATGYRLKA